MYKFPYKDIISTKQFTRKDLEEILKIAQKMEKSIRKKEKLNLAEWKIMWSLFYEPSTRTRLSFETAMLRLGWQVISVSNWDTSSLSKWESIEDNAKINSLYCDIIAIRHPEAWSAEKTAKSINIPVINAWDWANQHPSQALLDIYTILKENKRLDNLKIWMVWDLKYWRTTHSLTYLMWLFDNIEFKFISPQELKMPEKVISFLKEKNIKYSETTNYKEAIKDIDILYVTRLQKERFSDLSEYENLKNKFILNLDLLKNAKKDITIMHPLPRVNEVSLEVDKLPNAAFFRQAQNWLYIRMALLYILLNK